MRALRALAYALALLLAVSVAVVYAYVVSYVLIRSGILPSSHAVTGSAPLAG